MTTQTLSQDIARWALGVTFEDLPASVVADCKMRLLDTLGLILGSAASPIGQSVNKAAARLGTGTQSRCLPCGTRTAPHIAALVHGTQAHAEDFDDTHNESIMHSSASVVAVVLALGEAQGLSGRETLNLIAIGNEINCRLGCVAPGAFHEHGFHPTSTLGVLTCALLAGRMLGLDAKQCVCAMGIAGSQASGILEAYQDGTWSKTLHPGWAAHAGIVAGELAASGFSGPASVLEGRFGVYNAFLRKPEADYQFERLVADLGHHWESLRSSFKPYPCAHAIHAFVDVLLSIRKSHNLSSSDIKSVLAETAPHFIPMICEPWAVKVAPSTPTHARASLPYALAVAAHYGELGPQHYTETAIMAVPVKRIMRKIAYRVDTDAPPSTQYKGSIVIETKQGAYHRGSMAHNRGSFENPLGEGDLIAKFHANTAALAEPKRRHIVDAIANMQGMGNISELIDACI